jgi:hypothetical protein
MGRPRVLALCASSGLALAVAGDARAADAFVDRPLVLQPSHFSADAGIGFGQYTPRDAQGNASAVQFGGGSNLEAAVGLPFVGELGARIGYRFSDAGAFGQADHFARLFDPIVDNPGVDSFTNPEFRLRGGIIDLKVLQLGLETRVIIPATNKYFAITPGMPIRVHIPTFMRIDTGIYAPVVFGADGQQTTYSIYLPAQLFFQVKDAFFGPLTGFRYNRLSDGTDSVDIPAGIGGGYTFAKVVDVKAQLLTDHINANNWSSTIGGGIGVGVVLP